jgi:SepF-like predicted cell division protein (DUF552 family)
MRASGLSPAQCAVGSRIFNILRKIGLDPEADNVERFLSNTYRECKNRGITPETVAPHMEDLANIPGNVRLPEIEIYTKKAVAKIKDLIEQNQELINDISGLQQQKLNEEKILNGVLKQRRKIGNEIKMVLDTEQQLHSYGLTIADSQNL